MRTLNNCIITSLVLLFSSYSFAADITIKDAWIREAPPVSRVQAGYARFYNNSDVSTKLISASSPSFSDIEFHKTVVENGLSKMLHQTSVVIPHKASVSFKPEAMHMMLFNPVTPLHAGDKIAINFTFDDGSIKTANFIVKNAATSNPHQHMNH